MERAQNRKTWKKQGVVTSEPPDVTTPGPSQPKPFQQFFGERTLFKDFSFLKGTDAVSPVGQLWAVLLHPLGVISSKWGAQGSVLVLGVPAGSHLPLLPQGSSRDDTEQRYSSQYEERLDPFSSFSRKVRKAPRALPLHQPLCLMNSRDL